MVHRLGTTEIDSRVYMAMAFADGVSKRPLGKLTNFLPTTQSISLMIANLEKKLHESSPFGNTSAIDDYCYNRV